MTMSLSAVNVRGAGRPAGRIDPVSAIRSVNVVGAGAQLLEHGLELVRLGLGQEAHLAEVDAQDRHVDRRSRPGPPAGTCRRRRARPARRCRRRLVAQRLRSRRPATAHWSMPRIRHQPAARSLSSTASSMVGLYANPIRPTFTRHLADRRPGGRDRVVDPLVDLGARRTRLEVDEELAVALRALDRRRDDGARPEPERRRPSPRPPRARGDGRRASRTTPPFASAGRPRTAA